MKKHFYTILCCATLMCAAVVNGYAANGIIDIRHFNLCQGDTISFDGINQVYRDTIIRDTIRVASPTEDSIHVYVVNFGISYHFTESREMEAGQSFVWRGLTISRPGTYERAYQTRTGCDSTYTLTVTERYSTEAFYSIKDTTICEGNYVDWEGGRYTSTTTEYHIKHNALNGRDSIYVLHLTVAPRYNKTEYIEVDAGDFPAFYYRGLRFDSPGTQTVTYLSSQGCDSVYTVVVNERNVVDEQSATICAGDYYEWQGQRYTEGATYIVQEKRRDGTDSITHILHLTVRNTPITYLNATVCNGGYYSLGGKRYNASGVYRETFKVGGCDSVVVLSLTVVKPDTTIYPHTIAAGESFVWNGQTYTETGTYDRTFTNLFGCDSVARLVLTTQHVDTIEYTATICPGDSIEWNGIVGYATRDYTRLVDLPNGDKRLYLLHLTVKKQVVLDKQLTFCEGTTVSYNGKTYDQAGMYEDHYTCDTTYRINVTRYPSEIRVTNATFDGKSTYNWTFEHEGTPHSYPYTQAGTYELPFANSTTGCMDIYRLVLTVDSSEYHFEESVTICEGEDFEWHGYNNLGRQGIGQTTDYVDNYITKAGKDSTYTLHLTVNPIGRSTERIEFFSFPTRYRNIQMNDEGTYYDTIPTATGCDSVITIIAVRRVTREVEEQTICAGSYYEWRGQRYSVAGEYNETEKTKNGRYDSIYHCLKLTVLPSVIGGSKDTIICRGNFIVFGGKQLTERGVYHDTLIATNGCDSIVSLHLNIADVHTSTQVFHRDEGQTFTWAVTGQEYTAPYTYDTIMQNALGCDSIVRLVLTANHVDTVDTAATICSGDYLEWHGTRYYTEGNYTNVETQVNGDKIVFRLELHVKGQTKEIVEKHFSICPGQVVNFNGKNYSQPGTYDEPYNCDSIFRITIVQNPTNTFVTQATFNGDNAYTWRLKINGADKDTVITQAGTYSHLEYNDVTGCSDLYRLILTVDSSSYHFEQTAFICEGDDYTWSVNGQTYSGLNAGIYDYYKQMQTMSGKDSVYHLTLTVYPIAHTTEMVEFISFPAHYRGYQFSEGEAHDFYFKTTNGCDSIVTVIANKQDLIDETRVTICAGDYYDWFDKRYTQSGQYQVIEKTKDGNSDSIYHRLILTVKDIPVTHIEKTICRGSRFSYAGIPHTQAGVYTHTFFRNGCDSTVILTLNVLDVDTTLIVPHLPAGTKDYTWEGGFRPIKYAVPGIYDITLTNQYGCDSIVRLVLFTDYIDNIDTTATICPGESISWHGMVGRETKTYERVETNGDSKIIYRLHLTVLEAHELEQSLTICDGEAVSFNGKTYTEAGTYFDRYSCDTTYRITVSKNPTRVYVTNATWDGQGAYTWIYVHEGQQESVEITQAGTYNRYHDNSQTGCKDTYRLILTLDDTQYHFLETMTVCEGDDYTWRGRGNLSRQGIGETTSYFDRYQTITGQDSIYELQLTVKPAVRSTRTEQFCKQIVWKGVTYSESVVVYDTLSSVIYGCDSIVRINFDKSQSYYFHDTATITQGEVLEWHGMSINTEGLFRDPHTTVTGCDSTYEIGVGMIPATPHSNTYTLLKEICDGDVYEWRGKLYSTSGTYVDSVESTPTTPDSIFILKLTVWPESHDTVLLHMYSCSEDGVIRYNGKDYTQNDTVITTYPTRHGCDSIVKVFLHFNTASFVSDTLRIADNDTTRYWHEQKINHSGTYRYEELAEGSCYNREELVVFTYPTYTFTKDTAICQNEAPYYWTDGPQDKVDNPYSHPAGETKTYEMKYKTVEGFDSIYRLTLTIYPIYELRQQVNICEGEAYEINGKRYINLKSDSIYRDTTLLRTANNCDSLVYTEIYQYPTKRRVETVILRKDSTLMWKGQEITRAGHYTEVETSVLTGCDSINELVVIEDDYKVVTICQIDTPYNWRDESYYTSGVWHDTTYYDDGSINTFHTLDLTVKVPIDTIISLRGCLPHGVTFNDKTYMRDTIISDTLHTCDTIYTVHIKIDQSYTINIVDTICEHELPYIFGRQNPVELWREDFYTHTDKTACGCDSTVNLTLRIIPSLTKNDSTFRCEEDIIDNPVVLGNLVNPSFAVADGGQYAGTWQGKWQGVQYHNDTIVYNCDSSYYHHVIVRPRQKQPKDTTYYLCEGDSVQLFWPKTTWVKKDTIYYDTVQTNSAWMDLEHGYLHNDRGYLCDSITRWTVKFVHPEEKDTTAHILMGDSIWWGGAWRYYTNDYDSIGPAAEINTLGQPCKLTYTLHLIVDTAYYFRDTIDVCAKAQERLTHKWSSGFTSEFNAGVRDSVFHVIDSLKTYNRKDSIYDLFVTTRLIPVIHLYDTICEGTTLRFDSHYGTNTTERYLSSAGVYYDTITGTNLCDSILIMHLYVRNRVPVTHKTVAITDREAPYYWTHTWIENGIAKDATDTIRAAGEYSFLMPSIHGCDSVDSLHISIHQTHVFCDTIEVCALAKATLHHDWANGYHQTYTAPDTDGDLHYYDTLQTRIRLDSIYDLFVHYHEITITYLDSNICSGDSIRFGLSRSNNPRFLSKSGEYKDTLTRISNGCDSIIIMRLNVFPSYRNHETKHISRNEVPYTWEHWQGGTMIASEQLNADGEYVYHYIASTGCDSIDSLSLRIHQTYMYRDTVTICSDQTPYEWEGIKDIYTTGDYIKNLQTHDGYDSTHVRHIIVLPVLRTVVIDTLCAGDSLRFGLSKMNQPRFLVNQGIYYDTLTSVQHGCDSIIELRLNVFPSYHRYQQVNIADVDTPYTWEHWQGGTMIASEQLRAAGEYAYRFTTSTGCDSIDSLSLRIHPTYYFRDTITICASETPYTWYNADRTVVFKEGIYNSDTYYAHLQTHDGYDSTYVRVVNVLPVKNTTIRDSICEKDGNFFTFKGQNLTVGGTYRDTLVAANGCDSIITLILTVNKPYYSYREEHIVEGQNFNNNGELITRDTIITHKGQTPSGCDSTTVLKVIVHPAVDTIVTVCSYDLPYRWINKWNGQVTELRAAGIYRNDTTYVNGERMYYGLQLIVNNPVFTTIYDSICESDRNFYTFGGKDLKVGGTYRDTLTALNGCDSIVTLVLKVNKPYYHYREEHIVAGQVLNLYGQTFTEDTIYTIKGLTPSGCDSTTVLKVIVHPLVDTTVVVCNYELPYRWINKWNGKETPLYSAGIYRNDTTYVNGVRMYYGLRLVVNLPKDTTISRTICSNSYYQFKGQNLNVQGEYRDTLVAVNGCDSIVKLNLTVIPVSFQREEKTIFEGDSILFYGTYYKTAGTYTHREDNGYQCYNTHELVLSVLREVHRDTTAIICEQDLPYIWYGIPHNEAGDYELRTTWTDSAHVVTTLHLIVNPTKRGERIVDLCEGNMYIYKKDTFKTNTIFYDTIPTIVGCDSIIRYVIRVHPTFNRFDTVHISDKQTYDFNGNRYRKGGDYLYTGTTEFGCDSIHHLHLVVHPSYFFFDSIDLCKPDTIHWHGKEISKSGLYTDSLLTVRYGFDSVYHIKVNVHESYFIREPIEIVPGHKTIIHGIDISEPGVYYDTLTSIHGCDSIYQIVANTKRTIEIHKYEDICQGSYYEFYGNRYNQTGSYPPYKNASGDSIVYLHLTVHPASVAIAPTAYISKDELPYFRDGRMYTKGDTVYLDTLRNQYGCDSIIRFPIVIAKHLSQWYQMPLCPGSEIKIDGEVITQAGLYTFPRRSKISGAMDSLYRVEVYDAPAYDLPTEHMTICDGDTAIFAGKSITRGGHYDFVLKTVEGCDSILHLDLTVNPSYHFIQDATIADYESYTWMGRTYTAEGNYDRTWPTQLDCDSTYTLRLKVVETIRPTTEDVTICIGQAYTWRGKTYDMEGFYADTVYQLEANVSAIYTMQLYIAHPTTITSARASDVCADGDGFDITFEYAGERPTHYSIYFDALAKREGFTDVINEAFHGDMIAHVDLPQFASIVYQNHPYYVRPDYYTMRLVLDNGVCGMSRSDSIRVLVKYPSWIIEQNWGDVVAPLKPEYNGGYEFAQTEWYVNDVPQTNTGNGYLYNKNLHAGDQVVMKATREGENYAIPSCPLVIVEPNPDAYVNPIIVYPTQAPRHMPVVTIEALEQGEYEVYSSTGSLISTGIFVEGETKVTLPLVSGVYFIRTKQGDEGSSHKVLIY